MDDAARGTEEELERCNVVRDGRFRRSDRKGGADVDVL
jgi:hypothetical protein